MNPHKLAVVSCLLLLQGLLSASAQTPKRPPGGKIAVVVDERLSALRKEPRLNARLVRRVGRGRLVAIRSVKISREGLSYYLVNINSRTHGWMLREAVVIPGSHTDAQRLFRLISSSSEFDLIARARIFLDYFPRSPLRPRVLLMIGDEAERAALKLSAEAKRRLQLDERINSDLSYFLNYVGLDRYNRQGIGFVFDQSTKQLHYDGSAWREIVKRYPRSAEITEARSRLMELEKMTSTSRGLTPKFTP